MKCYEVLARRYCALIGENPDDEIEGVPAWKLALVDLEAAIDALKTFGVEARAPMADEAYCSEDWSTLPEAKSPQSPAPSDHPPKSNVIAFRRVA